MTYPTGEVITTTHNQQALPQQVLPYVTDAEYNAPGQLRTITLQNGVTTANYYDSRNQRLTDLRTISGSGTNLLKLAYRYDNVGNITSIVDSLRTETATYTYDQLDRLLTATVPNAYSDAWTYDTTGNITQRTDSETATAYTYGDSAHKHAVTQAGSQTFAYDANGSNDPATPATRSCTTPTTISPKSPPATGWSRRIPTMRMASGPTKSSLPAA